MYGKDFIYASTRIQRTIVRMLDTNEPVLVHSVRPSGTCLVENLVGGGGKIVHLDELNLEPVKLGYVNIPTDVMHVAYLQRMPLRRGPNNQGLRRENCYSSDFVNVYDFPTSSLRLCILGKYPKFGTVLKKIGDGALEMAFHRHWAICSNGLLMYKNRQVVGSIAGKVPTLDPAYKYLQEYLGECL